MSSAVDILNPHKVQLDLRPGEHDGQPVVVDGFSLRNVTNVEVAAPGNGPAIVTVSFLAEVTTPPRQESEPPLHQPGDFLPKWVTNGG